MRQAATAWHRNHWRKVAYHALFICLVLFAGSQSGRAKEKWDPIPAADLALKESATSPGADVEILLSEQVIDINAGVSSFDHHVRAKIYTAKGAEDWGKFRAAAPPFADVKFLAGRVAKADGTSIELQKSDFHESVLLKYDDEKWKQTAFAFPNLVPGDIVECRWTEVFTGWLSGFDSFCQEEFPVREFRFTVERFPSAYWVEWQNCTGAQLDTKNRTTMTLVVRNIPPYEKEEFVPPEWDFRGGLMLIRNYRNYTNTDLWKAESSYWDEDFHFNSKTGGLKQKVAELIFGAKTDDEKLQRLYDFCQSEIGNLNQSDTPQVKARKDKRSNADGDATQTAAQTLSERTGWAYEINYLFAGLARAAGLEVKRAQSASRAEVLNVRTEKGWAFLRRSAVAVKLAGTWHFFSPGNYWVPYGMLDWTDEGVTALMCDEEKVLYETIPLSPAEKSQAMRKGRFTLDTEGALDGEIEQAYTGHEGIALKSRNAGKSTDEVDRDFREQIGRRLPTAEVSELHWENLRTHEFPVVVRYKVHVPGYAEQAGKRLVVAPGFFETGQSALFTAEKRTLPIFFPFAREEHDDVEMILPEGFELDHPSAPANVAAKENSIGARYVIGFKPKQRILSYKRDFVLGGNQAISFQTASYPVLKQRFEKLHQSDTHALILKPKAEVSPTPATEMPAGAVKSTSATP